MSYNVIRVKLDDETGDTPREIYSRDILFDYVSVLSLPAGADVALALSDGADLVPVKEGDAWRGDPCQPNRRGIFAVFPAQAGVELVLFVGNAERAGAGIV